MTNRRILLDYFLQRNGTYCLNSPHNYELYICVSVGLIVFKLSLMHGTYTKGKKELVANVYKLYDGCFRRCMSFI